MDEVEDWIRAPGAKHQRESVASPLTKQRESGTASPQAPQHISNVGNVILRCSADTAHQSMLEADCIKESKNVTLSR